MDLILWFWFFSAAAFGFDAANILAANEADDDANHSQSHDAYGKY